MVGNDRRRRMNRPFTAELLHGLSKKRERAQTKEREQREERGERREKVYQRGRESEKLELRQVAIVLFLERERHWSW